MALTRNRMYTYPPNFGEDLDGIVLYKVEDGWKVVDYECSTKPSIAGFVYSVQGGWMTSKERLPVGVLLQGKTYVTRKAAVLAIVISNI